METQFHLLRLALVCFSIAIFTHGVQAGTESDKTNASPILSARVVIAGTSALTAGIYSKDLKVRIQNDSPSPQGPAVLIRGVFWKGFPEDIRPWRTPLIGATQERAGGSIEFNKSAQQLTHLAFETGLILPGESLVIPAPITPQNDGVQELVIRYVLLPHSSTELLFASAANPSTELGTETEFAPAPTWPPSKRDSTQPVLVRSTMHADKAHYQEKIFPIQLPLELDPMFTKTGISSLEAAHRAGLEARPILSFYREPVKAWFLTSNDGTAVAVRKVRMEHPPIPPTAPLGFKPKNYRWEPTALPTMDLGVPDAFCAGADGATEMILQEELFKDLLPVAHETLGMYFTPALTKVPAEKLFPILERARVKGIPVRFQIINPNHLGPFRVLCVGVTADEPGHITPP